MLSVEMRVEGHPSGEYLLSIIVFTGRTPNPYTYREIIPQSALKSNLRYLLERGTEIVLRECREAERQGKL